jgi:hypothetical protein
MGAEDCPQALLGSLALFLVYGMPDENWHEFREFIAARVWGAS